MSLYPHVLTKHGEMWPFNGPMYALNNLWAQEHATGHQSLTIQSPVAWSTEFDWTRAEDWQVTTYASVVQGWHWGWEVPKGLTGLPIPVGELPTISAIADFKITPKAGSVVRYDMLWDLWLHPTVDPTPDTPRTEIMIWLSYSQDYLGLGNTLYVAYPTIGGIKWKVNPTQPSPTQKTIAFMINGQNLTSATLDLQDFIDWVAANRPDFVPANYFLTSVEFGPEIYKGAGVIDVGHCSVGIGS